MRTQGTQKAEQQQQNLKGKAGTRRPIGSFWNTPIHPKRSWRPHAYTGFAHAQNKLEKATLSPVVDLEALRKQEENAKPGI